ncbi:hypothetical protein HYO65_gp293 [Tenacibaculum phage PTm1]|uniref:Uncharacterized protein n=2 Tax=Shirahamavirus PTm1 TaxID=2846435 RepID=A0A5S9BZI6_9CAUD|nr:hypothetical protein HYO65_gp293 [Tenacibaculum phage PTm1]BBI90685.1 hypothetical protein [Tenacibaculum phage PTm1]BBI90992.1 hypothetical protein [Tenacibaculum phage PTm5]
MRKLYSVISENFIVETKVVDVNKIFKFVQDLYNYNKVYIAGKKIILETLNGDKKEVIDKDELSIIKKIINILKKGNKSYIHKVIVDDVPINISVVAKPKRPSGKLEDSYFEKGHNRVEQLNDEVYISLIERNVEFDKIVEENTKFFALFSGTGYDMKIGTGERNRVYDITIKKRYIKSPNDYRNLDGSVYLEYEMGESTTSDMKISKFVELYKKGYIVKDKKNLDKYLK